LTAEDVAGLTDSALRVGTAGAATGLLTCLTVGSNILDGVAAEAPSRDGWTFAEPPGGDNIVECVVFNEDIDAPMTG